MYKLRWITAFALIFALHQLSQPLRLGAASKSGASRSNATKSATFDADYAPALATADRFLEAWRIDDLEVGMSLLTSSAKEKLSETEVETFFATPNPSAYEIDHGKSLRRGSYEFPVVLSVPSAANGRPRRRFSTLVVVKTGNNEWAIDKLP